MPHLTLEYSDNLGTAISPAVLRGLNHALVATGHFDEADIKTRALAFDCVAIGTDDAPRAFLAATLSLLSGRSLQVRQEIAQALLTALEAAVPANGNALQTSVQLIEIERDSYAKSHRA